MNDLPINSANKCKILNEILTILEKKFPNPTSDLMHCSPFELLIATILSAQCTDKQVNSVTPKLFNEYPTPDFLAIAHADSIENIIKPVGFYKIKTKNIINTAKYLVEKHNSQVPLTMNELIKLPGVGRKTANCVLSTYSKPEGIVVDTHVTRITNLLGIVDEKKPDKIEVNLMEIVERKYWGTFAHYMIKHGRATCVARTPHCFECDVNLYCNYFVKRKL